MNIDFAWLQYVITFGEKIKRQSVVLTVRESACNTPFILYKIKIKWCIQWEFPFKYQETLTI